MLGLAGLQAQEEEVRRRKAHEKAVEEARLVEIERKKERYEKLAHWMFEV
jgi:hypothetical protein